MLGFLWRIFAILQNFFASIGTPPPTMSPIDLCHCHDRSDSDVVGAVTVGYQGWFDVETTTHDHYTWLHWNSFGERPAPGAVTVDGYPDVSLYADLYETDLGHLADGTPSQVFSSYDTSTIQSHVRMMADVGIDGLALQRFPSEFGDDRLRSLKANQLAAIDTAARQHQRSYYLMYDVTRLPDEFLGRPWHQLIHDDLMNNVQQFIVESPSYAQHEGRPCVAIWGIGFSDEGKDTKPGTPHEYLELIASLQQLGYFVIGGVPPYWRTEQGIAASGFGGVYDSLDMISPWTPGRVFTLDDVDTYADVLADDQMYCTMKGILYQPVVSPGFSASNQKFGSKPRNEIPRLAGRYLWRQLYNILSQECNCMSSVYVAMFDEFDEGTQIISSATDSTMIPHDQYFVTMNADGEVFVDSDFYMRLVGAARELLNIPNPDLSLEVPVPTSVGPVWFRTGFEVGIDVLPIGWQFALHKINGTKQIESVEGDVDPLVSLRVQDAGLVVDVESPLGVDSRKGALHLRGTDVGLRPSFVYFTAFEVNIPVFEETSLSYWFLPEQENGRFIAVDLVVTDSFGDTLTLRDSDSIATVVTGTSVEQISMHAGVPKGVVGEVAQVRCTVGHWLAGTTIEQILVAYDRGSREQNEREKFGAYIDNLQITGPKTVG